jgi:hypothetical protein
MKHVRCDSPQPMLSIPQIQFWVGQQGQFQSALSPIPLKAEGQEIVPEDLNFLSPHLN